MDDLRPELRITPSAVVNLHERLFTYRYRPIETVGAELESLLDRKCREARSRPGSIFQFHDRYANDYSREIYRLEFQDGDRVCTLLGVVADDDNRRDRKPGKALVTVLTYKQAKASIVAGRWVNTDRTPIQLPSREGPASEAADQGLPSASPPESWPADTVAAMPPQVTPAPPAMSPIVPIGANGKPKRGYRRGGSTKERDAFVLAILRADPGTPTMGSNGIHARVHERFGIGMRDGHISRLRAQVAAESALPPARLASEVPPALVAQLWSAASELVHAESRTAAAHRVLGAIVSQIEAAGGLSATTA